MGEHRPYYVSLALSLLTLPFPQRFICCFKTQMYLMKEEELLSPEEEEEEQKRLASRANQKTDMDDEAGNKKEDGDE